MCKLKGGGYLADVTWPNYLQQHNPHNHHPPSPHIISPPHSHPPTDLCPPPLFQDYDDVSALLFTLRAVLGGGNLTTQPPNTELTALSCGTTSGGECTTPGANSSMDEPCDTSAAAPAVGGGKGGSRGKGGVTL